jgi:hypothetical protein
MQSVQQDRHQDESIAISNPQQQQRTNEKRADRTGLAEWRPLFPTLFIHALACLPLLFSFSRLQAPGQDLFVETLSLSLSQVSTVMTLKDLSDGESLDQSSSPTLPARRTVRFVL